MNKILLLGAQHGNELLGEHLHAYIQQRRPYLLPFITYKVGNPKAYKKRIRYNESDLNRSYTGKSQTYEERCAKRIMSYIKQNSFNIVLDLHTTTCEQPPCFIVPGITPELTRFIRASSITKVVQMNHRIVASSLIGNCPHALSIEINRREATQKTILNSLCNDIERYLTGDSGTTTKTVYPVDDLLHKSEVTDEQATKLHNFKLSSDGYYPILVGENSYKKQTEYLGFKSHTAKTIKL